MTATKLRQPRVSIIVPCRAIGPFAQECVAHCNELDYPDFEILVLPDEPSADAAVLPGAVVIPTGPAGPSEKRDIGAKYATGDILAFIDDDAFPRTDWLARAVPQFADPQVGAVGGPGVTPPSDGLLEQASGKVFESPLGGGPYAYRYAPAKSRLVDDYPTCNLLVRRSAFMEAGGFGTDFWPGEDTKLCLTITQRLGQTIHYDPDVLVYHHRRSIFSGHLKQVASYALHRGYFVKRFPKTSLRLSYFLPSLLLVGLFGGVPALFFPVLQMLYLGFLGLYLSLNLLSAIRVAPTRPALLFLVFVGTIITHLAYGAWFLRGLVSRRLADETKVKGAARVG